MWTVPSHGLGAWSGTDGVIKETDLSTSIPHSLLPDFGNNANICLILPPPWLPRHALLHWRVSQKKPFFLKSPLAGVWSQQQQQQNINGISHTATCSQKLWRDLSIVFRTEMNAHSGWVQWLPGDMPSVQQCLQFRNQDYINHKVPNSVWFPSPLHFWFLTWSLGKLGHVSICSCKGGWANRHLAL